MYRDRGHDPFLKAILERVEDDAPRLAYADWLGRRGDPRGEFIRIQCALDKLASDDPREADLVEREVALWKEHGVEWSADLPDLNSLRRPVVGNLPRSGLSWPSGWMRSPSRRRAGPSRWTTPLSASTP